MASQPPPPSATPQPPPPPPPSPDAPRSEWHAWRHAQRDYARAQWHQARWSGSWGPWFGRGWFWGGILVVLGVYFLLSNLGLLTWVRADILFPILIILFGLALIARRGSWWR